ncbi:MAG: hypothetical protein M3Y22_08530 [Pseudomonadota bacterium]|nr:hypothetical protein [Pseudomonadota bacterium]
MKRLKNPHRVMRNVSQIGSEDVQQWIDGLISAYSEAGLHSKTVNLKLSGIRNYWSWLQSHQLVPDDRNPFAGRRVINPASRRKGKSNCANGFVRRT